MTQRIDLSIGPVQGFIAKSRRTRDLWGSSYLLAFLTAHAMRGVEESDGEIVQPLVGDDPLYRWIKGERNGKRPSTGSLPNHFVAEVTGGDPGAVARAGVRAMKDAWRRACDAVWDRFVADAVAHGNGTVDIWQRQVEHFWEVAWIVRPLDEAKGSGRAADGLSPLARRKHWRSHHLPPEPGDKCTVMPDFQELSGFVRAAGSEERRRQDDFWRHLRERTGGPINLRENERLCAMTFVKRMFPRVGEDAIGWQVDSGRWPSTVNVAAVPWMRRVARSAPRDAAKYASAASMSAPTSLVPHWVFGGMKDERLGDFPRLDANWLHAGFVKDERRCPISREDSLDVRRTLEKSLSALHEVHVGSGTVGPPPSFYAILLADGDRLGRLVADRGGDFVSESLSKFTSSVDDLVRDHDGVTVYAGGDDVLAMLPVKSVVSGLERSALACAQALSDSYRRAFGNPGDGSPTTATLSAAVVFAHIRFPLGQVIQEAHRLLDDVAKDGNDRNSLASAVLKPGGLHCEWATTWIRSPRPAPQQGNRSGATGEEAGVRAVDQLNELIQHLRAADDEPGISSGLLYRMRDTLSLLCGLDSWKPGTWGDLPDDLDLADFVRAEAIQSLSKQEREFRGRADELTKLACDLLHRSKGRSDHQRTAKIGLDALMLARFLASPRGD